MANKEKVEEFTKLLAKQIVEIEDLAEDDVRAIAIEGLGRLIQKTPVDTGHARAGWQVSIDTPDDSAPPPDAVDKSGRQSLTRGQRAIKQTRGFPHIFISNNVEYIEVLDEGRREGASFDEGEFDFGAGRRIGARGSLQAVNGMLYPTFEELLDGLTVVEEDDES